MARIILLLLTLFVFCACKKNVKTQAQVDDEKIIAYLEKNSLNATKTESGLYYIIDSIGTGISPSSSSTVTVAYKGYFVDEKVFDQSNSSGIKFNLSQVILGWTEGVPYFRKGGKGRLLIPSALGYGNQARNGIPASSVLIFDIHLIDVH
ncbi:MAG: FKBP-type peptidyl-prolyl cis-trans isomerase [Bacteroidetes bacterium]|nr:FKBP-type peptidyl-prolyl cis-trans isomerase [Bacteroidota bacterium]HET6244599.1 FKBP-type peptidyl-prolyl cis-trans isomerase [Bacteroidia bacterium]